MIRVCSEIETLCLQQPSSPNLSAGEMPICTTCTYQLPYLYTVYESAHNLRLEQCVSDSLLTTGLDGAHYFWQPNCLNFADPYVEHDPLIILLDLILLKRGVFKHLLFNRGFEPRNSSKSGEENALKDEAEDRERLRKVLAQREKVSIYIGYYARA